VKGARLTRHHQILIEISAREALVFLPPSLRAILGQEYGFTDLGLVPVEWLRRKTRRAANLERRPAHYGFAK